MIPEKIDQLLSMYDDNQITRRQLIGALFAAMVAAPFTTADGQQAPAPMQNLTGAPAPKG